MNPFNTFLVERPEYGQSELEAECRALFERQKAIQGLIDGSVDAETLLDMLQEQDGISADEYVATVTDNVDFLLSDG